MNVTYLRDRSIEQARFSGQYPTHDDACGQLSPGDAFHCTRQQGHDEGPHVAHGTHGEALAWWDAARVEVPS